MTVKGSWQRPADQKKFNENFDKIFGRPKKEKKEEKKDDTARKNS